MSALTALVHKRLVLFTGKGGVGKSTCALGFAVLAARQGRRVLLCELSARSAAAAFLESATPAHGPQRPLAQALPGLWHAHLDPMRCLQEYLVEQLKIAGLVRIATENRVLKRLWEAAPSVNEMALLHAVYRHLVPRAGDQAFDLVIVDLPSTGHALAMLGVPLGAHRMIRMGALAQRALEIHELLVDAQRTAVCVVTLAEELPVNETVELVDALERRLQVRTSHVLVNRLLPDTEAQGTTRHEIDRLLDLAQEADVRAALVASSARLAEEDRQRHCLAALRQRVQAVITSIARLPAGGRSRIESVAAAMGASA